MRARFCPFNYLCVSVLMWVSPLRGHVFDASSSRVRACWGSLSTVSSARLQQKKVQPYYESAELTLLSHCLNVKETHFNLHGANPSTSEQGSPRKNTRGAGESAVRSRSESAESLFWHLLPTMLSPLVPHWLCINAWTKQVLWTLKTHISDADDSSNQIFESSTCFLLKLRPSGFRCSSGLLSHNRKSLLINPSQVFVSAKIIMDFWNKRAEAGFSLWSFRR